MRFVFVLLALIVLSPVLIASPCTAATPGLTLDAQLSSYSPGATDVHYEYRYDGYSAELVPDPFIIYSGDTAVVTIIVSDIDDPTRQGAPPTTPFCTGGYVGFGVLRPGTYIVSIRLLFFVNSSNLGYRNGPSSTFTWTIPARCTATSTFTVEPLTPGIDSTITLRSSRLIAAWYGVTTTTISGHTITVTDEINNEVPTTYLPHCLDSSSIIGSLPPGQYDVRWFIRNVGPPISTGNFQFTVSNATAPVRALDAGALIALAGILAIGGMLILRR